LNTITTNGHDNNRASGSIGAAPINGGIKKN